MDIGDAIANLNYQFVEPVTCCKKNLDTNNDEKVDLADVITILNYLYTEGSLKAPDGTELIGGGASGCFFYTYEALGVVADWECDTPCAAK